MTRFERSYKKEARIVDPMPKFLTFTPYVRVTKAGQQGATRKYTIVMTRTTIIMLGIFLLILSIACFVGGFMISKIIHDHKSPPIIIHTGKNIDPTELPFQHSDVSKIDIQEEEAAFEKTHSNKKDAKAAAASMSARATDKKKHSKISKDIKKIEKKSDGIVATAREKFHHLVGIPTHHKKDAEKKDEVEKNKSDVQAHGSSAHSAAHTQNTHKKETPTPTQATPKKDEDHSSDHSPSHVPAKNTVPLDAQEARENLIRHGGTVPLDSAYYNLDFYGQDEKISYNAQQREHQAWQRQKYADLNARAQNEGYTTFVEQESDLQQRYDVQVGMFNDAAEAQKVASAYSEKGYLSHVVRQWNPKKGPLYRISVGQFNTQTAAQEHAEYFMGKEKKQEIIVKNR